MSSAVLYIPIRGRVPPRRRPKNSRQSLPRDGRCPRGARATATASHAATLLPLPTLHYSLRRRCTSNTSPPRRSAACAPTTPAPTGSGSCLCGRFSSTRRRRTACLPASSWRGWAWASSASSGPPGSFRGGHTSSTGLTHLPTGKELIRLVHVVAHWHGARRRQSKGKTLSC